MKKSEFDKIMKMLDDLNREVEELALDVKKMKEDSPSNAEKRILEKEEKEKQKREKENRIYSLKGIYEEDKEKFADMVCDKEKFPKFKCVESDGGYIWTIKNKDGVAVEYNSKSSEMHVIFFKGTKELIKEKNVVEKIYKYQEEKHFIAIMHVRDKIFWENYYKEEAQRKAEKEEQERWKFKLHQEKEMAKRNGTYHTSVEAYMDSDGFLIDKPKYGKKR